MTTAKDVAVRRGGCWRSTDDGFAYRDLNDNGVLDPYEDPRLPVEERVDDLIARMTLEEKAALLFHQGLVVPEDGAVGDEPDTISQVATRSLVRELGLTHFNIYWGPGPAVLAEWHNRMQEPAESTRLGIPVTISSDPRHGFGDNPATSMSGDGFSSWPEPIGLAATRDEGLVREFADIARREYLAVGIRVALHPMADLATEPRWAVRRARSARTPSWRRGWCAPTSGASRARRSGRRAWPAWPSTSPAAARRRTARIPTSTTGASRSTRARTSTTT